ncbi:MAG: phosphate ABC transporter substrate-binding protein PstS [Gemmataceae bacterium]|nr:phosphate ABC transporter substrate-binding protein PstS [Gemmataceae bacterium]
MRRNVGMVMTVALACCLSAGCSSQSSKGDSVKLQGSGASFPAPLYYKWFKDYKAGNKNISVDYQSVGSGAGVKNFIDGTVDFGASDAAMNAKEIAQVDKGVVLLPMTAGTIVLAYNLEGVKDLKLSRDAYAGIFLGKVTKWNDEAIKKTNPGVNLPDKNINVIVRSDSSGTTYVFTKHLSAINKDFAQSPGTNKLPSWPVGTKSKGNEGVTGSLSKTPGSIGYIEYSFSKNLSVAALENKAGEFVKASTASAQSALDAVEMPTDLVAWLPDPDGKESYPIVTYTWLCCYKKYEKKKADALKDVINYCLTKGQESSEALGYVPLSDKVVAKVQEAAKQITAEDAKKASLPVEGRYSLLRTPVVAGAEAAPHVRRLESAH